MKEGEEPSFYTWVKETRDLLEELPEGNPLTTAYVAEYNRRRKEWVKKMREQERGEVLTSRDFVEKYYVERQGTASKKWDGMEALYGRQDLLPLWIADLDFCFDDLLADKIARRLRHQCLGYALVPDSYYEAVGDWMEKHYAYRPDPSWYVMSSGVVTAAYRVLHALTTAGAKALTCTPIYPPLQHCVEDTGRQLLRCPLKIEQGRFVMDEEEIERLLREERPEIFILCSPHNPVGRVWSQEELSRLFALCERYDALILSDEIHQDVVPGPRPQTSALAVEGGRYRDRLIVMHSVSKTFGLPGLPHANTLVPNQELRGRLQAWISTVAHESPNVVNLLAMETVYRHGQAWLEGLLQVVRENEALVDRELIARVPGLFKPPVEGTFLAFLDLSAYVTGEELPQFCTEACRLAFTYGTAFGGEAYSSWIRMNLATHPKNIEKACDRLATALLARGRKS